MILSSQVRFFREKNPHSVSEHTEIRELKATHVACGGYHTVVATQAHGLYSFGYGNYGQRFLFFFFFFSCFSSVIFLAFCCGSFVWYTYFSHGLNFSKIGEMGHMKRLCQRCGCWGSQREGDKLFRLNVVRCILPVSFLQVNSTLLVTINIGRLVYFLYFSSFKSNNKLEIFQ